MVNCVTLDDFILLALNPDDFRLLFIAPLKIENSKNAYQKGEDAVYIL
jgi:hypothetical protein